MHFCSNYRCAICGLFHHLRGLIMFFIFDCNDNIVGNSKGYKTHKGAQTQCNLDASKPTKIMALLWDRFHEKAQMTGIKTRIYSIRWIEQQKPKSLLDTMFNSPNEFLRNHLQVIHIK
jgi:hypothetical protein